MEKLYEDEEQSYLDYSKNMLEILDRAKKVMEQYEWLTEEEKHDYCALVKNMENQLRLNTYVDNC